MVTGISKVRIQEFSELEKLTEKTHVTIRGLPESIVVTEKFSDGYSSLHIGWLLDGMLFCYASVVNNNLNNNSPPTGMRYAVELQHAKEESRKVEIAGFYEPKHKAIAVDYLRTEHAEFHFNKVKLL